MADFRAACLVTGVMLASLALAMLAPLLWELAVGGSAWRAFAASAAATGFVGGGLALAARGEVEALSMRAAFLLTVLVWVALAAFAAAPFLLVNLDRDLTLADAFFEAMSGLTTTGSTVITGLDSAPPGILLWRGVLQWIGGVGIVVTAIAILPLLRIGGMQLFRMESSDASDKLMPRATQIAALIGAIYLALTVVCAIVYGALGMTALESLVHAMTTIATGGFSTSDASMGKFLPLGADLAAVIFMLAASLPFGAYMLAVRGDWRKALREPQIRGFFAFVAFAVVVMTLYLAWSDVYSDGAALRAATFNVVSVITGTGYATQDYNQWGSFAVTAMFCLTFVGGCAGSTACGAKIFRFQIAAIAFRAYLNEMLRPHGVTPMRYGGRIISPAAVYSVLSFFFLFFIAFFALALLLAALGLETTTAFSSAATAVANVGPGLGSQVGPAGTFGDLPDAAKWAMAAGMLVGRLEVFTVVVLLTPGFWRS